MCVAVGMAYLGSAVIISRIGNYLSVETWLAASRQCQQTRRRETRVVQPSETGQAPSLQQDMIVYPDYPAMRPWAAPALRPCPWSHANSRRAQSKSAIRE